MSARPLKYTGSRVDEYQTARIFYANNRAGLREAVADLNRREKRARKDAERRAKQREERDRKREEEEAKALAKKIAEERAVSEAKRKARQQRQNEKRKAQRAAARDDKREYMVTVLLSLRIRHKDKTNDTWGKFFTKKVGPIARTVLGLKNAEKAPQDILEETIKEIDEQVSPTDVDGSKSKVDKAEITEIVRQTKDKKAIKMKRASALDLDGQVVQEWDNDNGTCVFDFLIWRYGERKGCKKICNMDTLKMLFSKWTENGNAMSDYDSDVNGVCVYQCEAFCNAARINMYALDENDMLLHSYNPSYINKDLPPLIFRVKNNHFYAIMDRSKSICMRGKNTSGMEYKGKEKEEVDSIDYIEVLETNGDAMEQMIAIMNQKKKEVFPARNIQMNDSGLVSFVLDGVKYITSGEEEITNAKRIAEINEKSYGGESTFNILMNILEDEKYTDKSVCNPHMYNSLIADGVKFRTHYGTIGDYKRDDLQRMINDGSAICADIAKCYTACIENPFDAWIQYEFNDKWEKFDGKLKTGLYYVSTDDMTLFHSSNIYSNKIIERAQHAGIEFNIVAQAIPSKTLQREYFNRLLEQINTVCKGDKDLKKSLTNIITGFLGKHQSKKYFPKLTTDIETVWSDFNTEPFHTNQTFLYKSGDYYLYGYVQPMNYVETNLPMYIQILDWSNIRLYDMIEQSGGVCAFRKTDCAVIIGGKLTYGKKNGDYRPSDLPTHCGKMRPADERVVDSSIVSDGEWNKHADVYTSNQIEEVYDILMKKRAINNVSRAGTGKTYNALAIEKLFMERNDNAKVIKLAFTNKACLNFGGTTIHKFLKIDKDGKFNTKWLSAFRNQTVLFIIDEVSMIGSFLWRRLVELKKHMKAYFMLLGDYRQVPPVEEGESADYFNSSAMKYMSNYQQIEFIERQRYDEALWDFAEDVYEREHTDLSKVHSASKFDINFLMNSTNICYYNATRKFVNKHLNEYAAKTKESKYVVEFESEDAKAKQQTAILYAGLPIISIKNNKKFDMVNNETYIVKSVDDEKLTAIAMRAIDGEEHEHVVCIATEEFHNYFMLNYCSTTHCQQGATINNDIVIFDYENMSKELRYTALTRAKKLSQIHIRV
jgi:hypothetical protein